MGGQQLLEWVVFDFDLFCSICVLVINVKYFFWGIVFNEA